MVMPGSGNAKPFSVTPSARSTRVVPDPSPLEQAALVEAPVRAPLEEPPHPSPIMAEGAFPHAVTPNQYDEKAEAPNNSPKRMRVYTTGVKKGGDRPRVWLTLNKFVTHPKHGIVLLHPRSGYGKNGNWGGHGEGAAQCPPRSRLAES